MVDFYKVDNPLTSEEKVQINRLLGHDCETHLVTAMNWIYNLDKNGANASKFKDANIKNILYHTSNIHQAIRILSLNEYFLEKNPISKKDLERNLEILKSFFNRDEKEFNYNLSQDIPNEFFSESNSTHCVLYNLTKNAFFHGEAKKVNILVEKNNWSEMNPCYIPNFSKNYNEFIGFHVHDNGKGFLKNKKSEKYFTEIPDNRIRGFGLYFTGLVSKVFQAPVEIKSEPGKTIVSFYQPVYNPKKI